MSRIGKIPIKIADGVKVDIKKGLVTVSSSKGEMIFPLKEGIDVIEENGQIIVSRKDDTKEQKAFHGLTRSIINNNIIGLSQGFKKELQIIGTGYSAEVIGPWVKLSVGFAHEILLQIPETLNVVAELIPRREQGALGVQAEIKIEGYNKELVGKFAAEIKRCRPPLNYATGKGIRYKGEYIKIKPGKSAATE